jgi:hypothetical protein
MSYITTGLYSDYNSNSFRLLIEDVVDKYLRIGEFTGQLSSAQQDLYFQAIEDLKDNIPAYNYPTSPNLLPNAAMNILQSTSGCETNEIIINPR